MLTKGGGKADGVFANSTKLAAASIPNGRRVEILSGQRYVTAATDAGGGVQLASGNYANPVASDPQVAQNTSDIAQNASDIDDLETGQDQLRGLDDNNQTGTAYTLVLADKDKSTVWMNNAAANVVTIPTNAAVAFPVGTEVLVMMEGAGVTSVTADGGVTLNGVVAGSGDLSQYSGTLLKKRAENTWIATGLTVA